MIYRLIKQIFFLTTDICSFIYNLDFRIINHSFNKKNALVIGNGPSLNTFLKDEFSNIEKYDVYVCNAFAETKYFEIIKPENYCLLDPLYFLVEHVNFKKTEHTWESIIKKTNWPLKLYIPSKNKKIVTEIIKIYGKNNFIELIQISPITFNSFLKYKFYNRGVGLIASMTVVHLSLNVAILNRHSVIYLAGVDQSWHENIRYDDESHEVYIDYTNFNNVIKYIYGKGYFEKHSLVNEFYAIYHSILGFENLSKFAIKSNIKIFRTTKSYLHFLPFKKI